MSERKTFTQKELLAVEHEVSQRIQNAKSVIKDSVKTRKEAAKSGSRQTKAKQGTII